MEKIAIIKVDPLEEAYFIISCNLDLKIRWDIFICILVLYNSFSIPFELAFALGQSDAIDAVNWVVDAIFMIDIIVGFRTTFLDFDGKEIVD